MITIRNRYNGVVIFEADVLTMSEAVKMALIEGANLTGAYLTGAYLTGANLSRAYLEGAMLTGAYLTGANLSRANLTGAYLEGAMLTGANLAGANLSRANLTGANLAGAMLTGANLAGAKNAELIIAQTRILSDGCLIGWKKCRNNVIVKLEIPAEAKRSSAFSRKCRCEYAKVLEVIGADQGVSMTNDYKSVKYKAGETVRPASWSDNWQDECAGGIHFFITRLEAENYNM